MTSDSWLPRPHAKGRVLSIAYAIEQLQGMKHVYEVPYRIPIYNRLRGDTNGIRDWPCTVIEVRPALS